MELNFINDKERDIKNWQESINRESYGVKWVKLLPKDISLECANNSECLRQFIESKYYSNNKVKEFKNALSLSVNIDQIQADLEKILYCTFKINKCDVYVTTFHRAPFNLRDHFFYIIYSKNIKIRITHTYHELMHFLFYQNWYNFCKGKGLDDAQISNFKEALTVLLNKTLEGRGLPLDNGYEIHRELRDKILELNKNTENFTEFMEKATALVK